MGFPWGFKSPSRHHGSVLRDHFRGLPDNRPLRFDLTSWVKSSTDNRRKIACAMRH